MTNGITKQNCQSAESRLKRESPVFGANKKAATRSVSPLAVASLIGVKQSLSALGGWLITLGIFGLFGISLLDSALVPLPSGPDLMMITLSTLEPGRMPVYALAAAVGSTAGCGILFLAARRAGKSALGRIAPERRERVENLLGRYDMLAVMVPAVLPPPFPFKAFVLGAGVLRLKLSRFLIAIFVGRAARFLVAGWLAIQFGEGAVRIIKDNSLKVLLAAGVVAAGVGVMVYYRHRQRRSRALTVDNIPPG